MRFAPVSRTSAARNPPSIRPTIICGAVVFSRVSAASRVEEIAAAAVVCSAAYSSTCSLTMKAIAAREASVLQTRPSRTQPLWPPRPIAFESATSTFASRASFGT